MISSVFVYGTLKTGTKNHHVALAGGAFTVREASIAGGALYDLEPEGYPALVEGSGGVRGQLLTYADITAALPFLDELEGLHLSPPLYRRVETEATLESGGVVRAWVYFYARLERLNVSGARRVRGEVWPDG